MTGSSARGPINVEVIPYKLIFEMARMATLMAASQQAEERAQHARTLKHQIALLSRCAQGIRQVLSDRDKPRELEVVIGSLNLAESAPALRQLRVLYDLFGLLKPAAGALMHGNTEYASTHLDLVFEAAQRITLMAAVSDSSEWGWHEQELRRCTDWLLRVEYEVFIALIGAKTPVDLASNFRRDIDIIRHYGYGRMLRVWEALFLALAWHDTSISPPRIYRHPDGSIGGADFGDRLGQPRTH